MRCGGISEVMRGRFWNLILTFKRARQSAGGGKHSGWFFWIHLVHKKRNWSSAPSPTRLSHSLCKGRRSGQAANGTAVAWGREEAGKRQGWERFNQREGGAWVYLRRPFSKKTGAKKCKWGPQKMQCKIEDQCDQKFRIYTPFDRPPSKNFSTPLCLSPSRMLGKKWILILNHKPTVFERDWGKKNKK